jgi:hypothetical protein
MVYHAPKRGSTSDDDRQGIVTSLTIDTSARLDVGARQAGTPRINTTLVASARGATGRTMELAGDLVGAGWRGLWLERPRVRDIR